LDAIIVAGGFAVLGAGVALIWKKRPASSVWIIFAFGFLLVLIGSPIGRNLTNLSVDQKGLQVSFQSVRTSPSAERAKSPRRPSKDRLHSQTHPNRVSC